jgi:hypothetical protein
VIKIYVVKIVEVREDIRKKEDEERATRNECDM